MLAEGKRKVVSEEEELKAASGNHRVKGGDIRGGGAEGCIRLPLGKGRWYQRRRSCRLHQVRDCVTRLLLRLKTMVLLSMFNIIAMRNNLSTSNLDEGTSFKI